MAGEISSLENQKYTLAAILFLALTHLSNGYFHSGASTPLKERNVSGGREVVTSLTSASPWY